MRAMRAAATIYLNDFHSNYLQIDSIIEQCSKITLKEQG